MSERPPGIRAHVLALAALGVLLVVSVVLARLPLGAFNVGASLCIAIAKAAIVVAFFMKLPRSSPAVHFASAFGVVWLMIMLALTLADVLTRVPVLVR